MNQKNIWAPWRLEYLKSLDSSDHVGREGCFLCHYWNQPQEDEKNLVLWRTNQCMVLFNRFPYTGGHLLVAPKGHVASMDVLDDATMLNLMTLARDAQTVLTQAIHPQGFNIGINVHRCAGAGVPGHLHLHVVPRWEGDTNFMAVTGQVRVISQALDELYRELKELSEKLHLPQACGKAIL